MFSLKVAKVLCALGLSIAAFSANAQMRSNNGPRPAYQLEYQYAGQVSAPNHGTPWDWHGIPYCNTESPRWCNSPGQRCYTNAGYWWDNRNNCNWFNTYECRYK